MQMLDRIAAMLNALTSTEAGRRLTINLNDAISEKHVAADLVFDLLGEVAIRIGDASVTWRRFFTALSDIIYEEPDSYQFLGPETAEVADDWITVKSLSDIVELIRSTGELSDAEIQGMFGLATVIGPHTGIGSAAAEGIAQLINEKANDIRFPLAKSFPHPATRDPRPAPAWFSRWEFLPSWCKSTSPGPGPDRAGAFRDWLGLGHFARNHPLYVIRTKQEIDARVLGGRRPTVLDGFDNKLYKHRCSELFQQRLSGSTLDIVKAREAATVPPIADLEGGPEIISTALHFKAGEYECDYLGKTPRLGLNQDCTYLHTHMLPAALTVPEVVARLTHRLSGGSGAYAGGV